MERRQRLYRLELYDYGTFNQQIKPVPSVESHLFIDYGERFLLYNIQTSLREFKCQATLVSGLEQTGTQCQMHLYSSTNYLVRDLIQFQLCALCVLCG